MLSHQAVRNLPANIPAQSIAHILWMRGDLEFLLWAPQIPIWNQLKNLPVSAEIFVALCSRQLGKSTLGVIYALSEAIKNRDCCILIMGPDTRQTKDIVNSKMRFLIRTAPRGLIKQMKSENRWHVYHDLDQSRTDYTEIVIGGMNENSSSMRGKTVHKILIEEVVDVPEDNFLESMRSDLGPALTHSRDGKIIFLTTLPKYPSHPFIKDIIPKAKLLGALAKYDIYANTVLTEQQFQKCVELAGGLDSDDWKREYLCEITRDKKLVCIPDYDADLIRPFELPLECILHTTVDWGGVRDKTVASIHTYDYNNDIDLFWDEMVWDPNTSTKTIVEGIKEMERRLGPNRRVTTRFVDASHQLVSVDFLQEHGLEARIPQKSDWEASLNTLNGRWKQRKILLHPRCKFLALSAESGILNKQRTDFDRNDALGHMDGVANMMYAVRMRDKSCPFAPVVTEATKPLVKVAANVTQPKGFGQFKRSG